LKTRGIKVFQTLQFEGDARGSEEPCLFNRILLADDIFPDVGFVATILIIYGYDANTGVLWMHRLRNLSKFEIDGYVLISDHWGILSTPVVIQRPPLVGWYRGTALMERWRTRIIRWHSTRFGSRCDIADIVGYRNLSAARVFPSTF
jgi:hypothetical protein